MRTLLDSVTGVLTLIPDSAPDRRLIGHLCNCSDLTEFSRYLEVEKMVGTGEFTTDLGVSVDQLKQYAQQHDDRDSTKTRFTGNTVNLIGFNRE